MRPRSLGALCLGHFVGDSYTTFLAPLLPLLMARHSLSLSQAGALVAVLSVSTHLTQPAWGYWADRTAGRRFAVGGPLFAALCMSTIGLAPNVALLVAALAVGGLGMAAFHPQAASLARASSVGREALGMSLFISSGNLGFALGPVFATSLVFYFGLPGTSWAVIPGLLGFLLLLWLVPRSESEPVSRRPPSETNGRALAWSPLLNCFSIATLRAVVSAGFLNFLPVLFARRGLDLKSGGALVTLFLFAGAAGGVLGGYAAERWGAKPVMGFTLVLTTPLLLVAAWTHGVPQVLALLVGGALLVASHPININLAQSLAPARAGTVAAFMIGFAVGLAGLSMPAIGAIADLRGVENALAGIALVPLAAAALVLFLPASTPTGMPATAEVSEA